MRCFALGYESFVMIDALFNQNGYLAAKKMLDATAVRQDAIASNIANVETPGYKRLDLAPTFQAQLQQAVNGGDANQLRSSNRASRRTPRRCRTASMATPFNSRPSFSTRTKTSSPIPSKPS